MWKSDILKKYSNLNEKGEKIIDKIKATIEKLGYTYTINKVNTKYFGIPQERKRIIIIGCKEKKNIILKPNNLIKTLRDAIGDLESLQSGEKSKKDKYHFASIHNENHIKWLTPVPEGQGEAIIDGGVKINLNMFNFIYEKQQ